jgi:hypothetical protein
MVKRGGRVPGAVGLVDVLVAEGFGSWEFGQAPDRLGGGAGPRFRRSQSNRSRRQLENEGPLNLATLQGRLTALLTQARTTRTGSSNALVTEVQQGTLTAMRALYGSESSNEQQLLLAIDEHKLARPDLVSIGMVLEGALANMLSEVESGFVGSLHARVAAEVLGDLLRLAKEVLNETGPDAKNVGAVLVAAAFEDAMRRLAIVRDLPEQEKLADLLVDLKNAGILQGAQVAIAQSYLSFRNRALHARWEQIERPETQAVLAFTEGIIGLHLV